MFGAVGANALQLGRLPFKPKTLLQGHSDANATHWLLTGHLCTSFESESTNLETAPRTFPHESA